MQTQVLDDAAVQQLAASTKGDVLTPGSDGYDEARAVFNAMVDKRPAAIVRCKDPSDVMAAVDFARVRAAEVSVRGGGHGVTGSQLSDGGVTIDLTAMRRIHVDPVARTARAQAGATWGELDAATQEHGLAVTGGRVPSTGISGLTLGAGSGWLERKLGFACDNLIEADVVTADGHFLRASEAENPDLLWALKGGGGNFGVVTQFTYKLHPVGPLMYAGMLVWPGFMGAEVTRAYRDFMRTAPDEVGGALAFITAPPEPFVPEEARGKPAVGIICVYVGDPAEGERAFAPLTEIAGGPVVNMLGQMPYVAVQSLIEGGNQPGLRNYWKADIIDDLSDEAIDVLAQKAGAPLSPNTQLLFQPLGGAIARVPTDATAVGRRDGGWAYHLLSMWSDPAEDERHFAWTRELAAQLAPHSTGGVYVTFDSDQGEDRVRDAYRGHYDRLVAIKDRYDPGNMFRLGQNIRPSVEAAARADRPAAG
jgi:FAD/FMN-containing dehydrogenase